MDFEQWKGFEKGEWKRKIDVRNFIQKNYTPYEGNATFLTGTTEKTLIPQGTASREEAAAMIYKYFLSLKNS